MSGAAAAGGDMARTRTTRAEDPRAKAGPSAAAAAAAPSLAVLEDFIGYAIRRAQLSVFQDFNERMAEFAISTAQFSVMRLARDNPGLNQRALAEALGAETSRMVLIIDELERRGIVDRLPSTLDRRSRAIYLTAEGRKLLARLERRAAAQERAMEKRLRGDDKAVLLRMLRNLAKPL
jgi:DNA-binding MarR family transcriptional regulator